MLKIKAPNSTEASMCVPCAQALTGAEQKYVSSPNLKTGGFKLYKHKEQWTFFFFWAAAFIFLCSEIEQLFLFPFPQKKKEEEEDDDDDEEINNQQQQDSSLRKNLVKSRGSCTTKAVPTTRKQRIKACGPGQAVLWLPGRTLQPTGIGSRYFEVTEQQQQQRHSLASLVKENPL